MPAGCEFLDMITPQYTADLVSWGAIGARTTESQIHRELASGLSCPVGFKNGTDGNVRIAVDAIRAAAAPHHFLSVTKGGVSAIVSTAGNEDCHLILRGGKVPNYDAGQRRYRGRRCSPSPASPARLMIDCSHGNSGKMPGRPIGVGDDVADQVAAGNGRIFGVMVESHLKAGRQDLVPGKSSSTASASRTPASAGTTASAIAKPSPRRLSSAAPKPPRSLNIQRTAEIPLPGYRAPLSVSWRGACTTAGTDG